MPGTFKANRFERLLHPGPWEGLPAGLARNLAAFRTEVEKGGLERGTLKRAAKACNVLPSNFHASLNALLVRAEWWDAIQARRLQVRKSLTKRGVELLPNMVPSRVIDIVGPDGTLKSSSIRQEREPSGTIAVPGEALPGFKHKRISSLVVGGEVEREWQIQEPEKVALWNAVCEAIDARVERIPPRPAKWAVRIQKQVSQRLLSQLTFADLHIGALGWPPETGAAAWNLATAKHSALAAGRFLIDTLPASEKLLFLLLGDYLDSDGYIPKTPKSGHHLDTDGRFPKIADVGLEVAETLVVYSLEKFAEVILAVMPGNHDPLSAMWMKKCFLRTFANEPRVQVVQSQSNTYCLEFGKTLVTATHGDKINMSDLPTVIACDHAEAWGRTTHRFGHVGHLHHVRVIKTVGLERGGMEILQHPTIASRNAWAAGLGLSAARQLVAHSYRKEGGLAGKLFWHPDMLPNKLKKTA